MKRFFLIAESILTVFLFSACAGQDVLPDLSFSLAGFLPFKAGYSQGTILDGNEYDTAPLRGDGIRGPSGKVEIVPAKSFSLKNYAPIPGNQGDVTSCFAWASAYAAQTILESQRFNRTDKYLSTRMAFSPMSIYGFIEWWSGKPIGQNGASLLDTVHIMASLGPPRKTEFDDRYISNEIGQEELEKISKFPVMGFAILFTSRADAKTRVDEVKLSIYDGYPVIIGMKIPLSFEQAKDIWIPESGEAAIPGFGHAMCVVGYDDEKYGGAFEVMNSWGEEWGDEGYTWIGYEAFGKWVDQAWILRDESWLYDDAVEYTVRANFSGEGKIGDLPVRLLEDGVYRLRSALKNGTSLHVNVSGGGDSGGAVVYSNILAADASYSKIIPVGDDGRISGDAEAEHIIFLFSRKQLDIDSLIASMQNQGGDIFSRLKNSIGGGFISAANCKYEYDEMRLTVDLLDEESAAGMVLSLDYDSRESPVTDMVRLRGGSGVKDFYLGAAEVTAGEFEDFIRDTGYKTSAEKAEKGMIYNQRTGEIEYRAGVYWANPGFTQEKTHPVVLVSWYDAVEYCNWRSRREGLRPAYNISGFSVKPGKNANGYRLPTEAEWEYACRAGTSTPYYTGYTILPSQANYADSLILKSTPVRKYRPNQWGLYDMHGNVLEWCWDLIGNMRVVRSGTWIMDSLEIQSGARNGFSPGISTYFLGFRLARSADS
jgi:hypothetical protein